MTIDLTNVRAASASLLQLRDSDWFRMTADQLERANVPIKCAAELLTDIANAVGEVIYYVKYEHGTNELEHAHDALVELIDAVRIIDSNTAKMLDTMTHVRDQLFTHLESRIVLPSPNGD